ncbi:histidine kinase [Lactobacillus jensenii]|nr:ATP-binding protein [Lactobacillus jensenii]MDK7295277.1 histidine kinase [Lactobacillus jensenii]
MAVFILVIFSLTDTVLIENISNIPQLDTYIEFLPLATKTTVILISNVLNVVNLIIFMGILVLYAIYLHNREYEIKEKLAKAAQTNLELKNYAAKVLIDLNPEKAKEQLTKVSQVVKQGLEGIRAALNKLRPGALENYTLQAALKKMLSEYSELSQMKFDFQYEWGSAEFEKTTEDVIFRIVEESVTNALRHGHASQVSIHFLVNKNYQILIKDNGSGCSKIKPGFGLTQMKERVAIIGGHIEFKSGDGFEIKVEIPKEGANHD